MLANLKRRIGALVLVMGLALTPALAADPIQEGPDGFPLPQVVTNTFDNVIGGVGSAVDFVTSALPCWTPPPTWIWAGIITDDGAPFGTIITEDGAPFIIMDEGVPFNSIILDDGAPFNSIISDDPAPF